MLQRDLDRVRAQEQAAKEAEALKNRPPPEPEVAPECSNSAGPSMGSPSSAIPMDVSGISTSGTQKSFPGAGSFSAARRQSTISISSLSRPQFPHKLDLSSEALRINTGELAQGLGGGLPSPVTLAPKSGRTTATSEFPPDFMAAFAASEMATQPVNMDLTMIREEGPMTAHVGLDPSLGSSADRPIELDLDIDMTDMHVSLFGDEPTNDIPTAHSFDNTTTTTFDMAMDEMDLDKFQLESMMNPSDIGIIDMDALLNMDSETGTRAEGQNGTGDT